MRKRLLLACCAFVGLVLAVGCLGTSPLDQPSSDHSLYLENHGNESATFDILVVRNATNETVYNQSYVLGPEEEREVYNTNESVSDSIETFEFRWAAANETGNVEVTTNSCYGNAYVTIREDGTAGSTYSIC